MDSTRPSPEPAPPPAPPSPIPAPALQVHATLLLVQIAFGGFAVVAKAVLGHLPALALAGLRVALGTPFLVWLAWRRDRTVPARRDMPWLALLGGLGVTANQLFYITGLRYTTATNAIILQPSLPVFAAAVAAALGIERIDGRRALGIACSVAGALVLVNPLRLSADHRAVLGNGLILVNCLCYALFLVLQRPLLRRIPWRTLIAWSFVWGGGAVVLVSLPTLARLEWAAVPSGTWWGLAYIVAAPTIFAYSANTWAVRRSSPALVAAYSTLQPLVGAALAAVFLGERIGWIEGVGFALIASGLGLVSGAAAKRSA